MGFLDIFRRQNLPPTVPSILPDVAKQQIIKGQLPILHPRNLFLKNGEVCHFVDRAIYERRIVNKKRVRKGTGYSMPGLFKGTRVHVGGGKSVLEDDIKYETIKGLIYVTNRRVIFVGGADGFDKKIEDLVAVTPYANCIELQFSKETLRLFVPDGNLPHAVLRLI